MHFLSLVLANEIPILPNAHVVSIIATMDDVLVTQEAIEQAVDHLPNNSSPGPDGICPKLLMLTKATLDHIFTALVQSIDTGCVPDAWKIACVINLEIVLPSRRPISLASLPRKIEHTISSAIMTYLDQHLFFPPNQHGILHGCSCESQLFEQMADLHNAVHSLIRIGAVFIDFAKVFDKVADNCLVIKMDNLNISRNVMNWIVNFLGKLQQRVSANESCSAITHVKRGVHQGSELGPAVFLISINDISNNITSTVR